MKRTYRVGQQHHTMLVTDAKLSIWPWWVRLNWRLASQGIGQQKFHHTLDAFF